METKKKVLLCGTSCNYTSEDVAVEYAAHEADIEGALTGERFITVFEGDRGTSIGRDLDGPVVDLLSPSPLFSYKNSFIF